MIPNELVVWWFSVFYPLGGLFNILIYTRPKVQALRKIIDISRFMGFIVVVVAGGETPNVMDYISADHQQDDDNHSISPSRNSALERVCKALGYDFGDDFDIDAEVQRVMRGDYGEDRNAIQNARISNENSSVFVESNAKIYNSGKESGKDGLSSCLSITNETFQDDNAA
ncbi:predicted protein [Chaetoceros tenuissimus]|uniref:Uncharacterized protein n=1 Tax=Chaetoceros tenuissimus TaxID=426638 RepID=A0AAD3HF64_9STRA|nr:predicted protein [Chaetoceros tenuissimus]